MLDPLQGVAALASEKSVGKKANRDTKQANTFNPQGTSHLQTLRPPAAG